MSRIAAAPEPISYILFSALQEPQQGHWGGSGHKVLPLQQDLCCPHSFHQYRISKSSTPVSSPACLLLTAGLPLVLDLHSHFCSTPLSIPELQPSTVLHVQVLTVLGSSWLRSFARGNFYNSTPGLTLSGCKAWITALDSLRVNNAAFSEAKHTPQVNFSLLSYTGSLQYMEIGQSQSGW